VLPFTNMSGDPGQEFFADGIAEDIITALSRYPSLFVIARHSCLTYKGRAVDVQQVGRELGVRYVLEGSLRKSGNRIRVGTQLVEGETGRQVWAERYDRDLADIFAVQDEITEAVTIALVPAIADAEQHRALRKPPGSLDAWGAYQRGLWHLSKASAEDNALAEKFFQRAIDLDPIFAGGYKGLAAALNRAGVMFQTRDLAEAQSAEEALARRAVALDGGDAEARSRLAIALNTRGDHQGAQAEAERALAISPNLADAHGALGVVLTRGDRKKGSRHSKHASGSTPARRLWCFGWATRRWLFTSAVNTRPRLRRRGRRFDHSPIVRAPTLYSPRRSAKWVGPRKRRRRWRRPSRSRRRYLTAMSAGMSSSAIQGCGRKTTLT